MIPYFTLETIKIGPINLQVWGIFLSLALGASVFLAFKEAKRKKEDPEKVIELSLWVILVGIISARLFYVLNELDQFLEKPLDALKIWDGGLMLYGGIIGALITGIIFIKKNKLNFWKWTDITFYPLPLGIFIGRIGCFLVHDHLGKLTNVPWGIKTNCGIRHETSMYDGLQVLFLFIIFIFLRKRKWALGKLMPLFFIWYSGFRFIIDFWRANDLLFSDPRWYGLTPSQYLSILFFFIGIFLFIKQIKQNKKLGK